MKTKLFAFAALIFVGAASLGCGRFGGGVDMSAGNGPAPDGPPPPPPPPPYIKPKELVAELPQAIGPLVFSPDGKTLVSCGIPGPKQDTPLLLWDWSESPPKVREKLVGHEKCIWAMAYSPDGETLATCSEDGTVRLWETTPGRGKIRHVLSWDKGRVESLGWAAGGKMLVCSGGEDSQGGAKWFVRLWDVSAGEPKEISTFNGGTAVAVSPDGKTIATAWVAEIKIWDLNAGGATERGSLSGHRKFINAMAFSPDGKTLASVGSDHTVRLWDLAAGEERALTQDHADQILHVAWAPNGKLLATAGETNPARVVLRDATTKQLVHWRPPSTDIYASSIAFSPDSRHLAFPVLAPGGERIVWVLRVSE